jgi:hypothetical protein
MINRFILILFIGCSSATMCSVPLFVASSAPIALPIIYYGHRAQQHDLLKSYAKGFAWGALPPANIMLASWVALRTYPGLPVSSEQEKSSVVQNNTAKKVGMAAGLFSYLMVPFLIKRMK